MAPGSVVLHTEASRGFGGQEIRILAESRWLATHGWRALIAAQPGTRLLAEAERAGVPTDRVVAIGPGLDTARFHPNVSGAGVREELGLRGPAVGLVANIRGSKGHEHFLEAARLVLAERSDARFLIVGDGIGFED